MGVKLYKEPELKDSIMFCGWPGIGNIGLIAIDTLRGVLKAEQFAEIESWDFFNPRKVVIEGGLLKDLEFPSSKFYFRRIKNRDLIFFIGQQQPSEGGTRYAEGQKAYRIANLVLDVAEKFGCRRVYTSGAAVTQIHHSLRPRVWAVPNGPDLIDEVKGYENTVLMSGIEGRGGQGVISGLNGLLLGVAKNRDLEAVCLMGEIPYYLQGAPWPYPKASKSVLEVLANILDIELDLSQLEELARRVERSIEEFLETLYRTEGIPSQVIDEIEKLRYARQTELGPITDQEQRKIMEHIDELFKGEGWSDEEHR
ncbi:MAG: PAC2 family protein [Desulfobacterales bacterium]|nr:PAC2 family protein [Desulfobacterales bacterium]